MDSSKLERNPLKRNFAQQNTKSNSQIPGTPRARARARLVVEAASTGLNAALLLGVSAVAMALVPAACSPKPPNPNTQNPNT